MVTCLHLKDGHGRRDGDFSKVVQQIAHLDSVNLAQGRRGQGMMTLAAELTSAEGQRGAHAGVAALHTLGTVCCYAPQIMTWSEQDAAT